MIVHLRRQFAVFRFRADASVNIGRGDGETGAAKPAPADNSRGTDFVVYDTE